MSDEAPPAVQARATVPPPRVADAFVLCLVLLEGTAAGFIGAGGAGRIAETLLAGVGCVAAYLAGWRLGRYVALLAALAFVLAEAAYGRLGYDRYWEDVLLAVGVAGAAGAAAFLRLGVESRSTRMEAVLSQMAADRVVDDLDDALGISSRTAGALTYELERARRHNHALSVLVIRADDLDEVALRFGADAASRMLQTVAETIGRSLRATDIPVREEPYDFAVVLPETGRTEARIVAERIRLAVCEERLEFGPGDVVDPTVSIGLASFPHDATTNAQITEALHRALNHGVVGGGNRTVMHSVPEGSPPGWGLSQDTA